jgi:hypothetical protein
MGTLAEKLAQVQADLVKYRAARDAILVGGQAVDVGSRSITRADFDKLQLYIEKLESREDALLRGNKIKVQRVVLRDD